MSSLLLNYRVSCNHAFQFQDIFGWFVKVAKSTKIEKNATPSETVSGGSTSGRRRSRRLGSDRHVSSQSGSDRSTSGYNDSDRSGLSRIFSMDKISLEAVPE